VQSSAPVVTVTEDSFEKVKGRAPAVTAVATFTSTTSESSPGNVVPQAAKAAILAPMTAVIRICMVRLTPR
jgi:hypothetical protein